jgi:hypothetical protein
MHFDPDQQLLKNFDGRYFIIISIDPRSKNSKKLKKKILKAFSFSVLTQGILI